MKHVVAVLHFWFDFIVGDDWRVAVGVAAGLALTAVLTNHDLPAWWLLPLTVVVTLGGSLIRATRPPLRRRSSTAG
jgi:hypothetical protein